MQSVPVHQSEHEMRQGREQDEVLTAVQNDPNNSLILQQSPNMFQAHSQIAEPHTNQDGRGSIEMQMALDEQLST